jgi:hypothetical protein
MQRTKKLEKTESRMLNVDKPTHRTPGRVKGEGYGRRAQASMMASKNKRRVRSKKEKQIRD